MQCAPGLDSTHISCPAPEPGKGSFVLWCSTVVSWPECCHIFVQAVRRPLQSDSWCLVMRVFFFLNSLLDSVLSHLVLEWANPFKLFSVPCLSHCFSGPLSPCFKPPSEHFCSCILRCWELLWVSERSSLQCASRFAWSVCFIPRHYSFKSPVFPLLGLVAGFFVCVFCGRGHPLISTLKYFCLWLEITRTSSNFFFFSPSCLSVCPSVPLHSPGSQYVALN